MNYKIAVCDDEAEQAEYLAALAGDWAECRGNRVCIRPFYSAEEFLFHYEEEKDCDILLLDIEMRGINGVELAKRLREENDALQIIFITGYPDFIADGYEVGALHYLLKPVSGEKLNQVLDRAEKNLGRKGRAVFLRTAKEVRRIPVDSIVYVEVFSHKLMVHTLHDAYETKLSITGMEEMLGEGFVRCHRSYLAGISFIDHITKNTVVFDDGRTIPLARNAYEGVNQAFIAYYKEDMRIV